MWFDCFEFELIIGNNVIVESVRFDVTNESQICVYYQVIDLTISN